MTIEEIVQSVSEGKMETAKGVSLLIAYLFDLNGPIKHAAEALEHLGYEFGQLVYAALRGGPDESKEAQRRLAGCPADPLVRWLVAALAKQPTIWYGTKPNGRGEVIAEYSFHWIYAVRVCGWLGRKELIKPLVDQLFAEELGVSEVRELGAALSNMGDDAVDAVKPLLSDTRLVWTRPADERSPIAERAFMVLSAIGSPAAARAVRKGLSWWNMRRFSPRQRERLRMPHVSGL